LGRQTERLLEQGFAVVHANGHQHAHLLPRVLPVAAELAERYRIPWLRVVHEASPGWSVPRGLEMRVLNACGARARQALGERFALPDRTLGVRHAGHLD